MSSSRDGNTAGGVHNRQAPAAATAAVAQELGAKQSTAGACFTVPETSSAERVQLTFFSANSFTRASSGVMVAHCAPAWTHTHMHAYTQSNRCHLWAVAVR